MSIRERFKGAKGGFGITSYYNARMAGYSPQEIQADLESSGKGVGYRALDLLRQDLDREGDYRDKIAGQEATISGYDSQLSDYRTQVEDLSSQYRNALKDAEDIASTRDQYLAQFQDASAKYESEKAAADRYREEAVGQQLRAVRAGQAGPSGSQTDQMRGSLASGRTGYSSDSRDISDLAESMKAQGGLTDSVLNRQGPVVQELSSGSGGSSPGGQRKTINSAGTGSYYASRFR